MRWEAYRQVLDVGFRLLDQLAQRLRLLARGTPTQHACKQQSSIGLRKERADGKQAGTARASSLSEKRSEVRSELSGDLTYSARRVEGMSSLMWLVCVDVMAVGVISVALISQKSGGLVASPGTLPNMK